jgi:transcriptional regulator with XRE-family HTH domain
MSEEVISRIKQRRRELKMTQTELAKEANLTPAAISQFESGTRKPSFNTLSSLSDALKVTTDYLLGKKDLDFEDLSADPEVSVMLRGMMTLTETNKEILVKLYKFLKAQEQATSDESSADAE